MHVYRLLVSFHGDVIRQSFWFEQKKMLPINDSRQICNQSAAWVHVYEVLSEATMTTKITYVPLNG